MVTPATKNRILETINFYLEEQTAYRINNPYGSRTDAHADKLHKEMLQNILKSHTKNLSAEELATRNVIRNEIRKLNVKINPSAANYILYGRFSRWLLNQLFRNHENVLNHQDIFKNVVLKTSSTNNVRNLEEQLKNKGFQQSIEGALQKAVSQGLDKFHLRYTDVRHPNTDYVLHFKKIPGTGAYEFHQFDAAARPSWERPNNIGTNNWNSFSVNIPNGINATEAAHLANGRAIEKGEPNQWLVRNSFTKELQWTYFNVEKALKELPIKISDQELQSLIERLKNGQNADLKINIGGNSEVFNLQAKPFQNKIGVTNSSGKAVDLNYLQQQQNYTKARVAKIVNQPETPVKNASMKRGV